MTSLFKFYLILKYSFFVVFGVIRNNSCKTDYNTYTVKCSRTGYDAQMSFSCNINCKYAIQTIIRKNYKYCEQALREFLRFQMDINEKRFLEYLRLASFNNNYIRS